jgi:hypothetical protein
MADFWKLLKGPPYRPWYRHFKHWRHVQYGDIRKGATVETFRSMIEEAGLSIAFVDDCMPERTPDRRLLCRENAAWRPASRSGK